MTPSQPLPLFPLELVLFPDALLSLRVFEARYLDLVGECLRRQQPFGVVCLSQGAQADASRRLTMDDSIEGHFIVLRKGRKNYHLIRLI